MKKKKTLIISAIITIIIVVLGWAGVHFGINFVFDKYILGTTLSSMAENEGETKKEETAKPTPTLPEQEGVQGEKPASSEPAETKRKLTNTEIINKVMSSSSLTNKMASLVSYEDKKRVISIVLSNFTGTELAEIAKNVKGGITSDYKSKMISEARSRLTGAQWQECLNIAYKYIEQIRPYVE